MLSRTLIYQFCHTGQDLGHGKWEAELDNLGRQCSLHCRSYSRSLCAQSSGQSIRWYENAERVREVRGRGIWICLQDDFSRKFWGPSCHGGENVPRAATKFLCLDALAICVGLCKREICFESALEQQISKRKTNHSGRMGERTKVVIKILNKCGLFHK